MLKHYHDSSNGDWEASVTGTLFFGLRLLAIVSVCVGCADIGTPVQSRREDKESILRAAQFIRAGLESNLREWIEVELPFRPQAEADSNVQYVTASRVLAIAQSSQTSPDEKREIELFLQNSLLELDAGLYELQRFELLQLYLFPGETEEDFEELLAFIEEVNAQWRG